MPNPLPSCEHTDSTSATTARATHLYGGFVGKTFVKVSLMKGNHFFKAKSGNFAAARRYFTRAIFQGTRPAAMSLCRYPEQSGPESRLVPGRPDSPQRHGLLFVPLHHTRRLHRDNYCYWTPLLFIQSQINTLTWYSISLGVACSPLTTGSGVTATVGEAGSVCCWEGGGAGLAGSSSL